MPIKLQKTHPFCYKKRVGSALFLVFFLLDTDQFNRKDER